jgi:hypothetical protein
MMELYHHSYQHLHGMILNGFSIRTILALTLPSIIVVLLYYTKEDRMFLSKHKIEDIPIPDHGGP